MEKLKVKRHTYTFVPTAYATTETRKVMSVRRGTLILDVAVRVGVAFNGTTPTISIGDAGGATIFALTTDVDCANTGLKHGWGAAFSGANGKLYTETDIAAGRNAVTLTYTYTAGTTAGECTVIITYIDIE